MGSSLGTGYPRNLQGLHEIGTRQAIGLIFSPQRGEQYPLMWGFIPHTVGEILTYMIRDGVSMIFYVNIIHHIPLFRVSQPFCHECLLADFPIRNRPGLAVETYAYFNKMSAG